MMPSTVLSILHSTTWTFQLVICARIAVDLNPLESLLFHILFATIASNSVNKNLKHSQAYPLSFSNSFHENEHKLEFQKQKAKKLR